MDGCGESDQWVVPTKRSNKGEQSLAESVEGSRWTKGNIEEPRTLRTQGREGVSQGHGGVREAARRDKKQKFNALLHHVTVDGGEEVGQGFGDAGGIGEDGGEHEHGFTAVDADGRCGCRRYPARWRIGVQGLDGDGVVAE